MDFYFVSGMTLIVSALGTIVGLPLTFVIQDWKAARKHA